MVRIVKWQDIVDKAEWDTLILGNGASMAVSPEFGYEPLLKAAAKRRFISKDVKKVFRELDTTDFELVMRALQQTHRINELLRVQDDRSSEAYSSLQDALIKTVGEVHPRHEDVSSRLDRIGGFMKPFDTVLSLNYDLIVYWAIMEWSNVR